MTQTDTEMMSFAAPVTKPEKMQTLTCASCRMALYMSDRVLNLSTWKCPSCGAVTRT